MSVWMLCIPALAGYTRFGHIHGAQIIASIAITTIICKLPKISYRHSQQPLLFLLLTAHFRFLDLCQTNVGAAWTLHIGIVVGQRRAIRQSKMSSVLEIHIALSLLLDEHPVIVAELQMRCLTIFEAKRRLYGTSILDVAAGKCIGAQHFLKKKENLQAQNILRWEYVNLPQLPHGIGLSGRQLVHPTARL